MSKILRKRKGGFKRRKTKECQKSPLLGITYSEFDNKVGPQLLYAYPEGVMTRENFENLSDYVIVGKHLCGKIIAVKTDELQFMNFSVAIDNAKYERNTLLFSFGFVLHRDTDMEPFEPVLRKLTSIFVNLETEREYLFQESTKCKVLDALRSLYEQLTSFGSACLDLDNTSLMMMSVQLFRNVTCGTPIEIYDHNVPILRHSKSQLTRLPWDITLRHLLGYIDGVSHVKKIASTKRDSEDVREDIGMDIDCIKRALRVLSFYQCVIISDILQFSNVYQLTTRARGLLSDRKVLRDMRDFCSIGMLANSQNSGSDNCSHSQKIPSLNSIVKILLQLRPGVSLRDLMVVMMNNGDSYNDMQGIDLRRLLAIAQELQIISRKHEFPFYCSKVVVKSKHHNQNGCDELVFGKDWNNLKDLLKEQNECLDQICCSNNISNKRLVSNKNVIIIYK